MKWKPIETAPKDGTHTLGFWKPIGGLWYGDDYGVTYFDSGVWWVEDGEVVEPTHWMPLPDPPGGDK